MKLDTIIEIVHVFYTVYIVPIYLYLYFIVKLKPKFPTKYWIHVKSGWKKKENNVTITPDHKQKTLKTRFFLNIIFYLTINKIIFC